MYGVLCGIINIGGMRQCRSSAPPISLNMKELRVVLMWGEIMGLGDEEETGCRQEEQTA